LRSTQLALLLAIYAIPAVILFGGTMAVARVARWNVMLPIERAAWLLPGIIYALTPVFISRLDISAPPKGLLNLVDPVIVALLCWLVFIGRITLAVKRPQNNRTVAYATIGVNMAIAVAVVLFVPPLPQ
jgi:hypothetical protein